jgi:DNA repair protein RadC
MRNCAKLPVAHVHLPTWAHSVFLKRKSVLVSYSWEFSLRHRGSAWQSWEGGIERMLSNFEFVDALEAVRAFVLSQNPDLDEELSRLRSRARAFPDVAPEAVRDALAQCLLGQPADTPVGRRAVRAFVAQALRRNSREVVAHDELSVAESNASVVAMPTAEAPHSALQQEERSRNFAELAGSDEELRRLLHALAREPNIKGAVRLVRASCRSLTELSAVDFLARIGYPIAVAHARSVTFLFRLGVVRAQPKTKSAREEFQEQVARVAHLAAVPPAEVSMLFAFFAGAVRGNAATARCAGRPKCDLCPVAHLCEHARHASANRQPKLRRPIREWSETERPRERLLEGRDLSDAELMAIVLGSGTPQLSAVELARGILEAFGGSLARIGAAAPGEIMAKLREARVGGVGPAKAASLKAAFELGRRAWAASGDPRVTAREMSRPRAVFEHFRTLFQGKGQEEFWVVLLNTKNRLMGQRCVSRGTLNSSIVHPRDVFRDAVRESAAAVILLHNHPSGDPRPSAEDRALTRRLVEVGQTLGIRVLDHVIVGADEYYSFAENGEIAPT